MLRSIFTHSVQTFSKFMKQIICYQHTGNITNIKEDRKVELSVQVNSDVKQFSLFLSSEFSETRSNENISSREAIGMLMKRWNKMKDTEKRFYSVIDEGTGNYKARKYRFPKNTRIIDVKNTDPYSMVTDENSPNSDDVIESTELIQPQKLYHLNGFSVFTHRHFRIVSNKQPHLTSRKVLSKVATLWRNSTPDTRKLYRYFARRIRGRFCYSITGVINFRELFEEVLAASKTSGRILIKQYELDDKDYSPEAWSEHVNI